MDRCKRSNAFQGVQLRQCCSCAAGCIPNPESLATVSLRSADPFDTPVVNLNLFGEAGEADTMVECLKKEREVLAQLPTNFNMTELPRFPADITAADVRCLCCFMHACTCKLQRA